MKTIPYSRQSVNEVDIEAVCDVLRSDWLTQGPKVKEFEEALADYCGVQYCTVVSNGTMALHLACLSLGVGVDDVGLTSPISFLASANCIAFCGGRPDFVDIDPSTLCLSPQQVEEYCLKDKIPKVVIPVDFAGIPANLPEFRRLADRFGFRLIEDAAHAIGSSYKAGDETFHCGSCVHTDMAVFSFHPVKTITTGEGGAVLTNDMGLDERLKKLANHGMEKSSSKLHNTSSPQPWYYEMQDLGYNGRITDLQCTLGLSQLSRLDEFKGKRQELVRIYNKALKDMSEEDFVILPPWPEDTDPCFHLYPVRLGRHCKVNRDELFIKLREKGIYCQIHYIPIYRQPFYQEKYAYNLNNFPEAEAYFESCISLPLFPDLRQEDIQYVIDSLHSIIGSR